MSKRRLLPRLVTAAVLFAVAAPASAHHSYALYDMTKTMSAKATVKEFYWGAPHSSVSLEIAGPKGEPQYITLQGAAPTTMARAGFTPRDIRRGMKIEVTWHPLRNGKLGGTLSSITFEDGRTFKDNEFGNTAPADTSP